MSHSNTRAQACSQPDAAQNLANFQPPPAIELQADKLRQRFGFAPEVARTVAGLVFAVEVRA